MKLNETIKSETLLKSFLANASELYEKFAIKPLLYGSLGLQQLLDKDLNPDDIDILIPEIFINERWDEFKNYLESEGYTLIDSHEHTFEKDSLHFSYASIENLDEFAGIKIDEILEKNESGITYLSLNLVQYLKVYEKSCQDGYRINKKEKQDHYKIELIKEKLYN